MHRPLLIAVAVTAVLVSLAIPRSTVEADGPSRVVVTNFPEVQNVEGKVEVSTPIPHSDLRVTEGQVSPGAFVNPNSYNDGGVLTTAGFTSVSLALAGRIQGRIGGPGRVGALLVPDVPDILEALDTYGVQQFALHVEAPVEPSESGIYQSQPVHFRLGFPRYRVYFYNETSRTANATLYAYLSN
ncbi:MAG: hypothetical protein K8J08_18925 [Thermoanaerobaculia bacterium]|nr:hypothetical protein [Thermoanaerobaculia bacterium]